MWGVVGREVGGGRKMVPRGSKIVIFKNVWEYFSSVRGSKLSVFSIVLDLEKI